MSMIVPHYVHPSGIFQANISSSDVISIPDDTVQTADLLIGVDSLIIEGQILLV